MTPRVARNAEAMKKEMARRRLQKRMYALRSKITQLEDEIERLQATLDVPSKTSWRPQPRTHMQLFTEPEVSLLLRLPRSARSIEILRRCAQFGIARESGYNWLYRHSLKWNLRNRKDAPALSSKMSA